MLIESFTSDSVVKNPPSTAGDAGSIPGWERSLGGGNGNPLPYFYLENPMDRGPWRASVHGVAKELDTTEQLNNNNRCIEWNDLTRKITVLVLTGVVSLGELHTRCRFLDCISHILWSNC